MTNWNHTPAPWHHSPELSRSCCELVYASDKHLVANVGAFKRSDEENKANALLIAAAPRLLAACRMVVERWERGDLAEAARACSEAIAQATGRAA